MRPSFLSLRYALTQSLESISHTVSSVIGVFAVLRFADSKVHPRQRRGRVSGVNAPSHCYNHRRCIPPRNTALQNQVKFVDHRSQPLRHNEFGNDSDPWSALCIIDWTFGLQPTLPWASLHHSEVHHCWLTHTFQYQAFDILYVMQKVFADDVDELVATSLDRRGSPDRVITHVITNCLFIVLTVMDRGPDPRDPLDKGRGLVLFLVFYTPMLMNIVAAKSQKLPTTFSTSPAKLSRSLAFPLRCPSLPSKHWGLRYVSEAAGSVQRAILSFRSSWTA